MYLSKHVNSVVLNLKTFRSLNHFRVLFSDFLGLNRANPAEFALLKGKALGAKFRWKALRNTGFRYGMALGSNFSGKPREGTKCPESCLP